MSIRYHTSYVDTLIRCDRIISLLAYFGKEETINVTLEEIIAIIEKDLSYSSKVIKIRMYDEKLEAYLLKNDYTLLILFQKVDEKKFEIELLKTNPKKYSNTYNNYIIQQSQRYLNSSNC